MAATLGMPVEQAKREVFTVSTGKRRYENMLIPRIHVTNDKETENALRATVELRKVNIVSTSTIAAASIPQQMNGAIASGASFLANVVAAPALAATQSLGFLASGIGLPAPTFALGGPGGP